MRIACLFLLLVTFCYGSKWKVIRDKAVGLESHLENPSRDIISISISESHEYYVTCSSDNTANFYRVLMYPNLYPYWTHLYFAKLKFDVDPSVRAIQCMLTPNQTELLVLFKRAKPAYKPNNDVFIINKLNNMFFVSYSFKDLDDLYNKDPLVSKRKTDSIYGWSARDMENITNFHIVHPRDEYNHFWSVHDSNYPFTLQSNNQSDLFDNYVKYIKNLPYVPTFSQQSFEHYGDASMIVSPDSKHVAVQLHGVLQIQSKETSKANIFGTKETTLTAPTDILSASFSPASDVLLVATNTTLIAYLRENSRWEKIETQLDFQYEVSKKVQIHFTNFTACSRTSKSITLLVSTPTTIYITNYSLKNKIAEISLVQTIESQTDKKRVFSHSPDAEYFSFSENSEIHVWKKSEDSTFKHDRKISLPLDSTINVAMFNLKYYYLLYSASNQLFIEQSETQAPVCDPKSRTKSFYLPSPPDYSLPQSSEYNIERDGIFGHPLFYGYLVLFIAIYFGSNWIKRKEQLLFLAISIKYKKLYSRVPSLITGFFFLAVLGAFLFSMFEIFNQPAFVNDWPAHLHHLEQWYLENTTNYQDFMHYHGPCTYPAGFMYLYLPIYKLTAGSIQGFQIVWAIMESMQYLLLFRLVRQIELPTILAVLPVLSNRLHLYNVRVVINDFPAVFMMFLYINLIISKRYTIGSILYSFILSNKLNFIFYSPAILAVYFSNLGFLPTVFQLFIMGVTHIVIALPFLMSDPLSYVLNAYDVSRTLLWEKTRNFKFVGRIVYDMKQFNIALLVIILALLVILMLRCYKHYSLLLRGRAGDHLLSWKRLNTHTFFFVNFIFVVFARGLYTPFLCWYFYSLPIIMYFAGLPFFGNLVVELFATYIYFLCNLLVVMKTMSAYYKNDVFQFTQTKPKQK